MKIVIIGDIHLGAGYAFGKPDLISGINSRLLDYEKTLANIVTYTIKNKIELCIMVGDIFETRNPTPQQIVIFYRQLKRLSDAKITTYIIMGNHDCILTRRVTSSLDPLKELMLPGVSVFTDIEYVNFVDSKNNKLNIILMPYRNRQSYNKISNDEAIMEMASEINIAKNHIDKNVQTLLIGHMMMENTIPADAGEYGINELIMPFDIFDGIDTVINGHIHRPSILKYNPLFIYSGSMECKDFSEREHKKTFIVYDSNKLGIDKVSFKDISTRKFIDFDIDYSINLPDNPMDEILMQLTNSELNDSVVRITVKVAENKVSTIDTSIIRSKLHSLNVNCISDISVTPIISKQLRNQKINDAPDDISAFKHYISSQTNVDENVLNIGLEIITTELDIKL